MSLDRTDDLALVRRAASGDESSLAALFTRYGDPLFALIYHYLEGSRSDAEEVWQDAWLAALQALPTYCGQSRFFTWLGGIARHKIADHHRRSGRERIKSAPDVSAEHLADLMDDGLLPEEVLTQRAVRGRVVEALASLPEEYRTALTARYVDENSVEQVARLLGKSYKATESILSRARAAFCKALGHMTED